MKVGWLKNKFKETCHGGRASDMINRRSDGLGRVQNSPTTNLRYATYLPRGAALVVLRMLFIELDLRWKCGVKCGEQVQVRLQ